MNRQLFDDIASGYAVYKLLLFVVVSLIMAIIGGFVVRHANKYDTWVKTTGTITVPNCKIRVHKYKDGSKDTTYLCSSPVEYSVGEQISDQGKISEVNEVVLKPHKKGDTKDMLFNPNNIREVTVKPVEELKIVGYVTLILGIISVVLSGYGLNYCMKNRCTTLGAMFGISDAINLVSNLGMSSDFGINF